jgi:hypothetical protein
VLKVAAIISSVLLVSAFVCYRAGAFNWLVEASTPAPEAATSVVPPSPSTTEAAPALMPGSKSAKIIIPHDATTLPSPPVVSVPAPTEKPKSSEPAPVLLPSSKVMAPLIITPPSKAQSAPPAVPTPPLDKGPSATPPVPTKQAPATTAPARPILMDSSKSGKIFLPPPPKPAP